MHGGASLCEDFWPRADQVSDAENAELTLPFSSEEVRQAIASTKACSAPGPDGLPVIFFQRFWETMRPVIMHMFQEFYIGTLDMGRINFGVVALIPKVVGASDIRQFRPITVINVLARIFAKGKRIHDGILALHEIVHEVASKGLKGVFLKPDFQKAYDRLDWSFLRLADILDKAKLAGHIQGVVGHLISGGGVSHLQYVDDTMIMVAGSDSDIANLKFLLLCFEEMSGLNINFGKSEVVVLGYSNEEQRRIADQLNCKLVVFPISYLGMPLTESRIMVSGFDPLVGRVASCAEPWCSRFTSKGSKTVLISANLASLLMYMMGMYILPEGVYSSFDKELARFFWHVGDSRSKYHMVKWADIGLPKDRGGLGITASRRMNVALMLRLFWKSIQGIKDEIRLGIQFSVGNGAGTQFWLDPWLDGEPLRLRFPRLFAICGDPAALVSATTREDGWHVAFRLSLGPAEVHEWEALQVSVPFPTSSDRDSVAWSLSPSGEFSVSSAYLALCRVSVLPWLSPLWEAPLPVKIKIFVWQLLRDRLPLGTEVLKHHGPGNGLCPLCHVPETGTHIIFSCVADQALWGFVHETLGPEWEAHNLTEFLQIRANQAGRKRRLFWLIFAALTWTLWTTRNKMVIERVFQRLASDSFFKFLAFLQH
ncbi:hypothetical protein D1007_27219 [Hordeum vulgare]|nr:hypothetical protein D1007_27219 [Hordeum vulgare]